MRESQVDARGREPGIDRQRAFIGRDRLFVMAEPREYRTEICVRIRKFRIALDRSAVRLRRVVQLSALLCGDTFAEVRRRR